MSRVGESVGSGLRDRLVRPDYERPIGGGVYGRSPTVEVMPEILVKNCDEKTRMKKLDEHDKEINNAIISSNEREMKRAKGIKSKFGRAVKKIRGKK